MSLTPLIVALPDATKIIMCCASTLDSAVAPGASVSAHLFNVYMSSPLPVCQSVFSHAQARIRCKTERLEPAADHSLLAPHRCVEDPGSRDPLRNGRVK